MQWIASILARHFNKNLRDARVCSALAIQIKILGVLMAIGKSDPSDPHIRRRPCTKDELDLENMIPSDIRSNEVAMTRWKWGAQWGADKLGSKLGPNESDCSQ